MVINTKTEGNLQKNKHGKKLTRILREAKIRQLEVICSNRYVVKGLPP